MTKGDVGRFDAIVWDGKELEVGHVTIDELNSVIDAIDRGARNVPGAGRPGLPATSSGMAWAECSWKNTIPNKTTRPFPSWQ